MNLNANSHILSLILQTVVHLFSIEAAIFDNAASLVVCSKRYLEEKGSSVHKPSILEVIEKDSVTVVHPGQMPSCMGCRFSGNCPAKFELLKRITFGKTPVGVLAFSSFSEEGQARILKDLDHFKQTISDFAELIPSLLMSSPAVYDQNRFENYFQALTDTLSDAYIVIDQVGNILSMNQTALDAFNGFCLKSIDEFLPETLVRSILECETVENSLFSPEETVSYSVTSKPVTDENGAFNGAVLHFSLNLNKMLSKARFPAADTMHGNSTYMQSIRRKTTKIVNSPSSIFISGETGTGKSLLARSIHNRSRRADKPFVIINCANIPESLFESELFGYEAGAFTGALKTGKRGKLEMAEDGTIFLDEISEIPLHLQSKLLNVLQDRRFERVGGTTSLPLNARIISASNSNIPKRIAENRFRSDLFYRLNVIHIEMLPLRRRMDDLPDLLQAFLKRFNALLHTQIQGFSPEVLSLFEKYHWPGNIRQLENVVEYCVNIADEKIISPDDLPADFLNDLHSLTSGEESEYEKIKRLLELYGHDTRGKTRVAGELGISLRTLYRKLDAAHPYFNT